MAGTDRVGLEVDGSHVVVCTVQGGTFAKAEVFSESTQEESLERALAAIRRDDPVRAVLIGDGAVMRRLELTASDLVRENFTERAYRVTGAPREGTTLAGVVLDSQALEAGLAAGGLAAAAPRHPVEALYQDLGPRDKEVVPTPFTVGALDGISLALRYSSAELVLVRDGVAAAFRQLPAGGLATVEAVLGSGTAAGPARLSAALIDRAELDPIASGELERYLRRVLAETRDTIDGWARVGERVENSLFVYGRGATARVLDVMMSDAGLVRLEQLQATGALVRLEPEQRLLVMGAYLAALSYGRHMPQAAYPDPVAVAKLGVAATRRAHRRRVRTSAFTLGILTLAVLAPPAGGAAAKVLADRDLASATTALAAAGPAAAGADIRLLSAADAQVRHPGQWADGLKSLDRAVPADLSLTAVNITARADDLVVDVRGVGTPEALRSFEEKLRAAHVDALVPSSVTAQPGGRVGFTLSFTLAGGAK